MWCRSRRLNRKPIAPVSRMSKPRIAVLIPSYNAEHTIAKALKSLAANVEPHDIIIVDDGSRKLLQDCISTQKNMTILRLEKNTGITRALNHGLSYVLDQGYEFVARLDADDAASPDRLALQRSFMDAHSGVALLGGCGEVVSEQGKILFHLNHPTDHKAITNALYYNSCFLHPTFMIRTTALRETGLYSENYPGAEDYELARRLAQRSQVSNLPQYLVAYTWSPGGISLSKRRKQLHSRLKVQWAYRNFGSIHFYLGILKTGILSLLPVSLITAIKQRRQDYQKQ